MADRGSTTPEKASPKPVAVRDVDKQKRRLRCINRRCKYGESLQPALPIVCSFYNIEFKTNKMVCMRCFKKCLRHYAELEGKCREGKCVMDSHFLNFDSYYVIESSSEDESEPKTSPSRKTQSESVSGCINATINSFFNKNENLLNEQKKLCTEYLSNKIDFCEGENNEIDKLISKIESELTDIKNDIYEPYRPVITNESTLDLVVPHNAIAYNRRKKIKTAVRNMMIMNKDNKQNEGNMHEKNDEQGDETDEKKNEEEDERNKDDGQDKQDEDETSRREDEQVNQEDSTSKKDDEDNLELNKTDKKEDKNSLDDSSDILIAINETICSVPVDLPKEGPMVYPALRNGQAVYAMKNTLLEPWFKCVIAGIYDRYVQINFDGEVKLLRPCYIAYCPRNPVRFPVGCRVISKYSDPNNDDNGKNIDYFYAGVVAEPPSLLNKFRYMIFYDSGQVQYRHHKDIRLIVYKPPQVWNEVYDLDNGHSKKFLQQYLEKYPERHMVRLSNEHNIPVMYEKQWVGAKVVEVDASLVKLHFLESKKTEWLYRGSPKLWNIYDKQNKKGIRLRQSGLVYLNKPVVEYTTVEEEPKVVDPPKEKTPTPAVVKNVARKSTSKKSSRTLLKPKQAQKKLMGESETCTKLCNFVLPSNVIKPKKFVPHVCNPFCIKWTNYDYKKTKRINVLTIPLYFGFRRIIVYWKQKTQKCVMYQAPCGRSIRNMKEMLYYLTFTKSKMTIDLFDYSSWVKPLQEFRCLTAIQYIKDLSMNKEFRSVTCINNINYKLPPPMTYITARHAMPGVNINTDPNFLCGCDCTDNCQDKSKCACCQLTIESQRVLPGEYKDPNIGYSYRRLPDRVLTGIFECNSTCKCNMTCLNRVVQQPLSQSLQLFMTEKKGWGVRCLNDIPQGSFVCIYVGYLLTEADANEGGLNYGDEYLAELDYIEVVEHIKAGYESHPKSPKATKNKNKYGEYESSDEEYQVETKSTDTVNTNGKRLLRERKAKEKKKNQTKVKKKKTHATQNKAPRKPLREYFGENENVYIMDAKTSGNIGRYINHSCNPNIFVQNVFVDTHDLRFPWVSFFALHYIEAGTELTWDYSYEIGSVPGKVMKCHCESNFCRGRLL